MATLVLTAVGVAVGGPIGAAIGAIVGQQIDQRLFEPKARQGPRLGDLAVQTSSYGSAIPKLFGTMRVAGTMIWATDLIERRSSSGGGKGQPKTVNYSYSASFAVALSGRPIRSVRRIWADGKLLRGAGGDFKSRAKYRLYLGDEDQEVDPLIAAAEGLGGTPAYRGIAYAVFENFQLADYGNRIPSLTFEVEADPGSVSIGIIARTLSDGAVMGGVTPELGGYAASGDSLRSAIEALADVVPLSLVEDSGALRITSPVGAATAIAAAEIGGATGGASSGGKTEIARRAADSLPGEVSIVYHDTDRDYQAGMQRATRGGPALRADRRALPAAIDAASAKGLAEHRLAALSAGRATAKLHLSWRRSGLRPGALLTLEGHSGVWKVSRWTLDRMVTSLDLVRVHAGTMPVAAGAQPGRPVAQPDLPHGPTSLHLLDLPLYGELPPDRPRLLAAAAGVEAGWRRAELMISYDGGASWEAAGATAAPAVMGTTVTPLAAVGSALFDLVSSVDVELLNDGMWLEGRSDAALIGGANLAAVGYELIQFGTVEPLGGTRFRLSRLLLGRLGTEWAAEHAAGEAFVLIEAASLAAVQPPLSALAGDAVLLATGIGDGGDGVEALCTIGGAAMRPPSPTHLRAERLAGGDLSLRWVRRSRAGWSWIDGNDAPLGEETETYRLTLSGAGFERQVSVAQPAFLYTAADQAADGATGTIAVHVVQLGTSGASRAATMIIN